MGENIEFSNLRFSLIYSVSLSQKSLYVSFEGFFGQRVHEIPNFKKVQNSFPIEAQQKCAESLFFVHFWKLAYLRKQLSNQISEKAN